MLSESLRYTNKHSLSAHIQYSARQPTQGIFTDASLRSCCETEEPGNALGPLIIADYTHMETVCVVCALLRVHPRMCAAEDPNL